MLQIAKITSSDQQRRSLLVTHYQRKPRPIGNYSLEAIFHDVRTRLHDVNCKHVEAPFFSNGFVRRFAIIAHAWLKQVGVTHVTGDITFATLLMTRRKTVLTILDCIGADRPGWKGWLYRKIWFKWPVRRSALVTTISEASKSDIVKFTGCDPNKVVVTGVAISTSFQPMPKPFNTLKPRILQVGTAPNKNLERLAEAIRDLSCELRIVGQPNDSQRRALAENRIEYSHVVGLSESELLEEYRQCDIVSFASTFEGFGMPILEGNAVGRVVVTGNCTSMPEVAGDAACLVDPFCVESIRNGMIRVMQDPNYRSVLLQNGFRNVGRYSPDSVAEKYREVYLQVSGKQTGFV